MNYELTEIEWKLNPEEIKKKFLLFHDSRILERNIWGNPVSNDRDLGLIIKSTAYQVITKEFRSFFIKELHRIKTAIAEHHIADMTDKFGRYIRTNFAGLLKLKNEDHTIKPPPIEFNKPGFEVMYEKCTLRQIRYYLQVYLVIPLIKYIEEDYQAEVMPSSYVYPGKPQPKEKPLSPSKLTWNGPVNKLVTIFYELSTTETHNGKPNIKASTTEITNFILDHFLDSDGQKFSKETIQTILRPGRPEKRAPEHKKYNFPT